jgi:hypothetical protein
VIEAESDLSFEPVAPEAYTFKPGLNFSGAPPASEAAEDEEPLPLTQRLDEGDRPAPAEEPEPQTAYGQAGALPIDADEAAAGGPAEETLLFAMVSVKKPSKKKLPLEPRIATLEQRKKRKGAAKHKAPPPDKDASKDKNRANDKIQAPGQRSFDF